MKRSDELVPLSRDHHHGLVAAQKLKRATEGDAEAARAAFLAFWSADGRRHFQIEEDLLLPAFARHAAPDHPAVVQTLVAHLDLRRRAGDLARGPVARRDLRELGTRLAAHIRHEETVLFPLIERTVPGDELVALGEAIMEAERH